MDLYFIQVGKTGPIKIGKTSNHIKYRLSALQTACPYKLRLIKIINIERVGSESKIKKMFKKYRIRGEWYKNVKCLREFIEQV